MYLIKTSFLLKFDTHFSLSILSILVHPDSKIVQKSGPKGVKGGQVLFGASVNEYRLKCSSVILNYTDTVYGMVWYHTIPRRAFTR